MGELGQKKENTKRRMRRNRKQGNSDASRWWWRLQWKREGDFGVEEEKVRVSKKEMGL